PQALAVGLQVSWWHEGPRIETPIVAEAALKPDRELKRQLQLGERFLAAARAIMRGAVPRPPQAVQHIEHILRQTVAREHTQPLHLLLVGTLVGPEARSYVPR